MADSDKLIALVAIDLIKEYIRRSIEDQDFGTQRFCAIGMSDSIIIALVNAAINDPSLGNLDIKIPYAFDVNNALPNAVKSDESITHWRHCKLPHKKSAILFVATYEELQRNDKSVEKVTKITTDILRGRYSSWIEMSGIGQQLSKIKKKELKTALRAANESRVVRNIDMLSKFVLSIKINIIDNILANAIDDSLHSLHLPKHSGFFENLPEEKRGKEVKEWKNIFNRLYVNIRPFLVMENKNGDSIKQKIHENYNNIKSKFSQSEKNVIEEFLNSDLVVDQWNDSQSKLANLDWRDIECLFDGVSQKSTLGEKTLDFFEKEYDDSLDEYRHILKTRFPREPSEIHIEFYNSYVNNIQDKNLANDWEKYIYKKPKYYTDFLLGMVTTIYNLKSHIIKNDLKLESINISIPKSNILIFWKKKNTAAVRYFALRYYGLDKQFANSCIHVDFGCMYDLYFPEIHDDIKEHKLSSKEARTIKFEMACLYNDGTENKQIFYWEMSPVALATIMPNDFIEIANNNDKHALLAATKVAREPVSIKGMLQSISLNDINTLLCDDNSSLLSKEKIDCGKNFQKCLNESKLDNNSKSIIEETFNKFICKYTEAIRSCVSLGSDGFMTNSIIEQAELYGELLNSLLNHANNDMSRREFWKEILDIGIIHVYGGPVPAAIIAPWHPLRLAEMGAKTRQIINLISKVTLSDEGEINRSDLLLDQVEKDLQLNCYPEICVSHDGIKHILLSSIDNSYDYTLCESPIKSSSFDYDNCSDVCPDDVVKEFRSIGVRYLELLPHEKSNFSILLYNPYFGQLPTRLYDEFAELVEQDKKLQCDLFVTHDDNHNKHTIYKQQNVAANLELDSLDLSATSQNFLSRMRVSIVNIGDLYVYDGCSKNIDIVLMYNVASRNSVLKWKSAPEINNSNLNFEENYPARWTRRSPAEARKLSSTYYLVAPVQPRPCHLYINFIYAFVERSDERKDYIPTLELEFSDGKVKDIFDNVHKVGEWVVNIDELVDKRLLEKNNIQVIRNIQGSGNNCNITVSTTSELKVLRLLLDKRLRALGSNFGSNTGSGIVNIISRANKLSGQVVMRAAAYGRYADELLGLVLSMEKLSSMLESHKFPISWHFLDDLSSWFGAKGEQIADIMALAPRVIDGQHILIILVSEAKYVGSKQYQKFATKSLNQTSATLARIARPLNGSINRVDRNIWLHKLGDLLVTNTEHFELADWNIHRWSEEIRKGNVSIGLLGYSHVYVHDADNAVSTGEDVVTMNECKIIQEVFNKSMVADEIGKLMPSRRSAAVPMPIVPPAWLDSIIYMASGVNVSNKSYGEMLPIPKINQVSSRDVTKNNIHMNKPNVATSTYNDGGKNQEDSIPAIKNKQFPVSIASWIGSGADEKTQNDEAWLDEIVKKLKRALLSYDMTAQVVDARLTPNAALVRLKGYDNITVSKVEKRKSELLTSHGIDVINVLAFPGQVVVMVARDERAILKIRDLWRKRILPDSASKSNDSLLLGECESDGSLLYLNVGNAFDGYNQHGPHTLIAGETGSGKGVLVQSLLLDICATNSPRNARIKMIDPKSGIDFPWLRGMPHLDRDIITNREEAISELESLVDEMERRNRLLAEKGFINLSQYNQNVESSDILPRIWLFHDELADWMMINDYRDAVELSVNRLGVKARAAGINLMLITQRPDKDALPMQLRANLTNRLVLKVADKKNSILVLDEPGAELLLGRGHLAARLSGEREIIFAQVPYAAQNEINELSTCIKSIYKTGE